MVHLAQELIKEVLDSYVQRDADKAYSVWTHDAGLDEMYSSLLRELLTYMMEDPRSSNPCTHLLFMAKNIERIGDHVTNIAENTYYLVDGTPLEQARPKSDISNLDGRYAGPRHAMMKPLLLIVEDEAPLVTMLRYNLEREGFRVCEAADGEEALVQIAERKPDLVLLDWMLPLVVFGFLGFFVRTGKAVLHCSAMPSRANGKL